MYAELGGIETPGFLVVTRIPDVIVPECVVECMSGTSVSKGEYGVSVMACVEMDGPIQTGDMNGEPGRPHEVVWVTASAPPDAACEVRSVFCERPKHARLRDWKPRRNVSCAVHNRHVHG